MEGNIIRFTYKRGEALKFVSHLDLLHVFERAIRRANLPVAFSQGFNPRMLLVFGNPLPVGLMSDCEMVDVEFETAVDSEKTAEVLNGVFGGVIEISGAEVLKKPYDNITKLYTKATYEITLETMSVTSFAAHCRDFLAKSVPLEVMKKSKSGEKLTDIRPMIYDVSCEDGKFLITVACAQEQNLKAELAVNSLAQILFTNIKIIDIKKVSVS